MGRHGSGTLWLNRRKGLYVVKVTLLDGTRKERTSKDRATAEGYLRDMLRAAGRGLDYRPRLTVAAFLDGWVSELTVRPQTLRRYESLVRVHLSPGLGHLPLQGLKPSAVDRFLATKKGRTAQLCREVLRNALNVALHDRIVEYNAAELARPVQHEPAPVVILTPGQLGRFLEGTTEDRLHALYMLAASTGMREGELLGLAWNDVEADAVNVRSQLVRLPGEWRMGEPKTKKGRRRIVIAKVVAEALTAHRQRMAKEQPDLDYLREGLVFVTPERRPLYGYRVVNEMRAHLKRLGIVTPHPLKLHELRHGLASYMKADGVPDQVLADYLGHSTTRLIERYAHSLAESDGMVAERMGRRLG